MNDKAKWHVYTFDYNLTDKNICFFVNDNISCNNFWKVIISIKCQRIT